jgi:hypothetical protein
MQRRALPSAPSNDPPDRLIAAQIRPTRGINPMNLKNILRQPVGQRVEPDGANLRQARSPLWMLAVPAWRIDAVGGGHFMCG